MKFHKISLFLLLGITFLGSLLRTYRTFDFPPSLNWDEVSLGYNAYSLVTTGKDEWGVSLPTIFRAYGDYKLPGYIYASALPVLLGGLNAFTVRAVSLGAGILLIPLTYILALRSGGNRTEALLAALLVACEPWTFMVSRIALEANLAALFLILGLVLYVSRKYSFAFLMWGIAMWSYNSARVYVPSLVVVLTVIKCVKKSEFSRRWKKPWVIFLIFLVPVMWQMGNREGQARYQWVTLLDEGAVNVINEQRTTSQLPQPLPRFIHNKATYFIARFSENYINHFAPDFLFIKGGSHYQFSIPGTGLLSLIGLPFFYLGLGIITISRRYHFRWTLLAAILLAPVAGSITRDAPHTLRAITMVPLPMVFIGIGIGSAVNWLKKIHLGVLGLTIVVITFMVGWARYYVYEVPKYSQQYAWAWQYGYQEVVTYLNENEDKYDAVIFTKRLGEPHEFVLFYKEYDSEKFRSDPNLHRYFRSNWFWVDSFDKYRFINDWEMKERVRELSAPGTYLVISSPDNPVSDNEVTRITYPDGKTIFILSEIKI